MIERQQVAAGHWGDAVGYSRAVRAGELIFVAGTTASAPDGSPMHVDDAFAQTEEVLRRIVAALLELGAGPEHVVATTIYVFDVTDWPEIGRAHAAVFGEVKPAATLVEISSLIAPGLLVEISAIASLV